MQLHRRALRLAGAAVLALLVLTGAAISRRRSWPSTLLLRPRRSEQTRRKCKSNRRLCRLRGCETTAQRRRQPTGEGARRDRQGDAPTELARNAQSQAATKAEQANNSAQQAQQEKQAADASSTLAEYERQVADDNARLAELNAESARRNAEQAQHTAAQARPRISVAQQAERTIANKDIQLQVDKENLEDKKNELDKKVQELSASQNLSKANRSELKVYCRRAILETVDTEASCWQRRHLGVRTIFARDDLLRSLEQWPEPLVRVLGHHTAPVEHLEVAPESHLVATTDGKDLQVSHFPNGAPVPLPNEPFFEHHGNGLIYVSAFVFSGDGESLFVKADCEL